jgi:hypothetical protein
MKVSFKPIKPTVRNHKTKAGRIFYYGIVDSNFLTKTVTSCTTQKNNKQHTPKKNTDTMIPPSRRLPAASK